MASTKTAKTLQASASNTAGSTTTATTWTMTTSYGGVVQARVTNGATGPTVGCSVTVNISVDNSTWRQFAQVTAGTTNNGVYDYAFDLPAPIMYSQVVFSGNTGQAVTVEAYGHELTTI